MDKKVIQIIVFIILFAAGTIYFYKTVKPQTANSTTPSPTINTSQLTELTGDWQTYYSPEWGFSINKPFDVKTELTQNGVHFMKLGPSQSTGTELFDGLSLLIFAAKVPNENFENFVQQEFKKVKNEPVYESVSELKAAQIAKLSGFSFTATGIGKSTIYFLRNGSDGYIKISDMTVEPPNAGRDFHKTVEQMLNSLQIITSGPSGYASESTAVNTTKEYAAGDLNTTVNEITVISVNKKEWNNGCLGLEQEGEMCTQVITPGYEITIKANGKQRIYRTNESGSIIKIQ